jgi:hypothetical protein
MWICVVYNALPVLVSGLSRVSFLPGRTLALIVKDVRSGYILESY